MLWAIQSNATDLLLGVQDNAYCFTEYGQYTAIFSKKSQAESYLKQFIQKFVVYKGQLSISSVILIENK